MRFLLNQFVQLFSNLGDLLEVLFRLPMRMLGGSSDGRDEGKQRSTLMKVLLGIGKIIALPLVLLLALFALPVRAMTVFPPERRRDFLLGVPSVVALILIGIPALRAPIQAESINNKYRGLAQQAIADEEFEKSATYFARIVNATDNPGDNDLFAWAMSLLRTGDQRAIGILNRLAPDDTPGLERAHAIKAVNLADTLLQNNDPDRLKKLKFHLDHCGGPTTPQLQLAWANYHLALEDPGKALGYINNAAEANPQLYILAANVALRAGQPGARQRALETGRRELEARLNDDPFDVQSRVTLALFLTSLEEHDAAEILIREGIRINDSEFIRNALADFLLAKYDRTSGEASFSERLDYLKSALSLNINNPGIYERLGRAQSEIAPEEIDDVKVVLNESIASGDNAPMAHFTLSNILWLEGDKSQAQWHIEQAYTLQPNFLFIGNNLAWMLATGEDKDLDRALEIAEDVVSRNGDPRFRDTLGTIYFELGDFQKAKVELESAVSGGLSIPGIHQKLAKIYTELGQPEIAAAHRKRAEVLMQPN
ncbi:MAG: hypothetical protein AAF456_04240 [Planctomycetota bacterium]